MQVTAEQWDKTECSSKHMTCVKHQLQRSPLCLLHTALTFFSSTPSLCYQPCYTIPYMTMFSQPTFLTCANHAAPSL